MELIFKCSAIAVTSALVSLLIKRFHPELSFALSAATLAVILLACVRLLEGLGSFTDQVQKLLGAQAVQLQPILKCLGISYASRIGALLCKDASQNALSSAVETAGVLCAAAVAVPSVITMLRMVGALLP